MKNRLDTMTSMTPKERVLRTVNHQETDRVPFDMFGTSGVNKERIRLHIGAATDEEMFERLGIDIW